MKLYLMTLSLCGLLIPQAVSAAATSQVDPVSPWCRSAVFLNRTGKLVSWDGAPCTQEDRAKEPHRWTREKINYSVSHILEPDDTMAFFKSDLEHEVPPSLCAFAPTKLCKSDRTLALVGAKAAFCSRDGKYCSIFVDSSRPPVLMHPQDPMQQLEGVYTLTTDEAGEISVTHSAFTALANE